MAYHTQCSRFGAGNSVRLSAGICESVAIGAVPTCVETACADDHAVVSCDPPKFCMKLAHTMFAQQEAYVTRLHGLHVYTIVDENVLPVSPPLMAVQLPLLDCARTSMLYVKGDACPNRQWVM